MNLNSLHNATIFALSSGRPPAAIAVVRVSGAKTRSALESIIDRVPEPRRAAFVRIKDPSTANVIDEGLALWFPGPKSETGEDLAELHLHGGHAVIAAVLGVLAGLPGLRLAEPGEFTRRAFENGKLDLTAVEGLADLVAAETEAQRRQAYGQLRGALGNRAEAWRGRLIEALALVEASIDFSDEGDVPDGLAASAVSIASALRAEILQVLDDGRRGERLRDGMVVAIAGPPNAGKSSLLNRIAKRDVAIVTAIAGTTRDALEVHLDLEGCPVTMVDTAGIRETDNPIEQEGVRRAKARAGAADLVLWVTDIAKPVPAATLEAEGSGAPVWQVRNKVDLVGAGGSDEGAPFDISAMTGEGVGKLVTALTAFAGSSFSPVGAVGHVGAVGAVGTAIITRERHRQALTRTAEALGLARRDLAPEILAEHLRQAATELGRITGRVDVEDVLGRIFSEFCVGK